MDWNNRLQSVRSGDEGARNDLIEEVLPQIEAYVRLNVGPALRRRESCSDLVQTICREVMEDVDGFHGTAEEQFRRWLFRLAQRKIHMRHRAHQAQCRDVGREESLDGLSDQDQQRLITSYRPLATPSQHASMREEVIRIEAAIGALPEEQRRVITLARILGLSHREIAEELGKEEAAVRKTLSRARARLSLLLALDEPDS
ncbi:MAG: sigma-70 family RNA polymerase sigma factor [Planctomycetota bacterium]